MSDYVHWATLGALCEFLPLPENRVTLADEKDRYGLPVVNMSYGMCDNDQALLQAAQQTMERILHAAGSSEVMTVKRFAHLVGGARMGRTAEEGVVDGALRSFAVPNLHDPPRQRLPDAGIGEPGADDHGSRRPGRAPARRRSARRAARATVKVKPGRRGPRGRSRTTPIRRFGGSAA